MIFLKLCADCAPKPGQIEKNGFRWNGYEQWCRLPSFCAECEAKVAQCVRGHGLVEPNPSLLPSELAAKLKR